MLFGLLTIATITDNTAVKNKLSTRKHENVRRLVNRKDFAGARVIINSEGFDFDLDMDEHKKMYTEVKMLMAGYCDSELVKTNVKVQWNFIQHFLLDFRNGMKAGCAGDFKNAWLNVRVPDAEILVNVLSSFDLRNLFLTTYAGDLKQICPNTQSTWSNGKTRYKAPRKELLIVKNEKIMAQSIFCLISTKIVDLLNSIPYEEFYGKAFKQLMKTDHLNIFYRNMNAFSEDFSVQINLLNYVENYKTSIAGADEFETEDAKKSREQERFSHRKSN